MRYFNRTVFVLTILAAGLAIILACGGGGGGDIATSDLSNFSAIPEMRSITGTLTDAETEALLHDGQESGYAVTQINRVKAIDEENNTYVTFVLNGEFSIELPVGHSYVLSFYVDNSFAAVLTYNEVNWFRLSENPGQHLALGKVRLNLGTKIAICENDPFEGNLVLDPSPWDDSDSDHIPDVVWKPETLIISTASLDYGAVGFDYLQTLVGSGGLEPYTWVITGGELPDGLSMNSSGQLFGKPTAESEATLTFRLTDSRGLSYTSDLKLIVGKVKVITTSLDDGIVGVSYSESLSVGGGTPPFVWSITDGTLPPGLSLATDGIITGIPTMAGEYPVTVLVQVNKIFYAAKYLNIKVIDKLAITTATLADGEIGMAYSQTLEGVGGTAPYTWSVKSGVLPDGIFLDGATGEISGTPTTYESQNIIIGLEDNAGQTDEKEFTLNVEPPVLTITANGLSTGAKDVAYSQTVTVSGGILSYTWSLKTGVLPDGLSLNTSTGEISGTPTTVENQAVTITVTDNRGVSVEKEYILVIYLMPPGTKVWEFNTGGIRIDYATPTIYDGKVYVGSTGQKLYCINAATGLKIWEFATGYNISSSVNIVGGMAYFGGLDGKIYCLNADTGVEVWSAFKGADFIFATPTIVDGFVYAGNWSGRIFYCLNAATGVEIWRKSAIGIPTSQAPVVGDYVVVGTTDALYCYKTSDGTEKWRTLGSLGTGTQYASPVIVDGKAYLAMFHGILYCFDMATGKQIWVNTDGTTYTSGPVVDNGFVYLGCESGKFFCFNADTGEKAWEFAAGDKIYLSTPAVVGDYVYFSCWDNKVYCLNATTGQEVWAATIGTNHKAGVSVSEGYIYVSGGDGKLYCLYAPESIGLPGWTMDRGNSRLTGTRVPDTNFELEIVTERFTLGATGNAYTQTVSGFGGKTPYTWSKVSGGLPDGLSLAADGTISGTPTVVGDFNFRVKLTDSDATAVEKDLTITIYNVVSGSKKWQFVTGGDVFSSPAVSGGYVYVGSDDNKLYCLNADTGVKEWEFVAGDNFFMSSPTVTGGYVYFGNNDKKVYCLNALTGAKVWEYLCPNSVQSSSVLVYGGRVYVGCYDGKVYCLTAATGAKEWEYTIGSPIYSSPSIYSGKLYIGSENTSKALHCINPVTGVKIWDYNLGNATFTSSPAISGGKLFIGISGSGGNPSIICLNPETGALFWSDNVNSNIDSSPSIFDGKLYAGVMYGTSAVSCWDISTGKPKWNFRRSLSLRGSPSIANGYVYIGCWDNQLYCLDAYNGEVVWYYGTSDDITSTPAVANGCIYFGSKDNSIYCIRAPETGNDPDWPMFKHNVSRTGSK